MVKLIRTVIADQDRQFVSGLTAFLRQIPQIEVVGAAFDGPGAIEVFKETLPDVVVLDLHLPLVDGIKTTRAILDISAQTGILTVSSAEAGAYALQAIKMGARGFWRKTDSMELLAQAIFNIFQGDVHIPSELASLMLNEFDQLA